MSVSARRSRPTFVRLGQGAHRQLVVGEGEHFAVVGDHQEAVELGEERAVVADCDHGAVEAVERPLERFRRVDVEVVGRLVEQQHVVAVELEAQDLEPRLLAA